MTGGEDSEGEKGRLRRGGVAAATKRVIALMAAEACTPAMRISGWRSIGAVARPFELARWMSLRLRVESLAVA
jgi:hypothetical protein